MKTRKLSTKSKIVYWLLRQLGGDGFANKLFSTRLLWKYLFIQKVLRINSHVPWPVHTSSQVMAVDNIIRGNRCPGLSPGCYLQGYNGIILGNNVWIGPGVGIISANHDLNDYHKHLPEGPVRIGDHCWIGMNAIILPGVELGEHVIVAAGAVVTHSFDSNCVVAGNPAKVIKQLEPYQGGTE